MAPGSNDEALQRFETIWEHVECGICIIDAETREILDINPVAARLFGADKSSIVGHVCHKFICPAESKSCPIMDLGQVVDRSERKFVRADGKIVPIIKSVAKIQYNGRLALLESFTDLSLLKEAEEKVRQLEVSEQANQAKSNFLSRMSHEMRTPMNAIIGMTKIAENTGDVGKLRYCLSSIDVSAKHLLGLINDVLDMSKIEAGKFELENAPLHVEEMLAKICSLLTEKTDFKNIELAVSFGRGMHLRYLGDELRLSQVFANLLSNAVKFTPNGGHISLEVREEMLDERLSLLSFLVEDNGIGMTEEQIGRLFNAFEQGDSSIARRFGGTGLGLAITKSIVEKMNGGIRVESEPGMGTKFSVEVELERLPDPAAEHGLADLPELAETRILLASADPGVIGLVRAELGPAVSRIEQAASAEECFELAGGAAAGGGFDLLLLDCSLPGLNFTEQAARLSKVFDPAGIIVLAPFLSWSEIEHVAGKHGIIRCLYKPVFPSSLRQAVLKGERDGCATSDAGRPECRELPDFSGIRLLLVEDIEINREIFISLLEDTGISIDVAVDGFEAVNKFKAAPDRYDIIIMDIQMPGMSGYEATGAIRHLPLERAASIPIVAMSADVFKQDIDRCLACGMNDHLPKPIDEALVMEKIKIFCRN